MGHRVYIGRLARDASRRDLERLFRGYGRLEEATVKTGFGFVEFADKRDAEDAVHDLHGTRFLGNRIIVEEAMNRRRSDRDRVNRLVVKNITPESTWQDLKDLMKKAGRVTFADILKDRDGEGVVEFAHREDMKYALRELDNARLNGQRISLMEAGRRRRSSRSRSRSPDDSRRGRSRSRSRSASMERRKDEDPMDDEEKDNYRTPSPSSERNNKDEEEEDDKRSIHSDDRSDDRSDGNDNHSDRD
ncbi:hypothetical protein BDC45DRAFT_546832 [Circinella umbellata]|nr:hypothetical protein BDC45DRAFT_546832 [Circinella umbellata]